MNRLMIMVKPINLIKLYWEDNKDIFVGFFLRFNPFYFSKNNWEQRKYIILNNFRGYQMFDAHYWKPCDRNFLNGDDHNSKRIAMIGLTLFHYRFELFFEWAHNGRSWKY